MLAGTGWLSVRGLAFTAGLLFTTGLRAGSGLRTALELRAALGLRGGPGLCTALGLRDAVGAAVGRGALLLAGREYGLEAAFGLSALGAFRFVAGLGSCDFAMGLPGGLRPGALRAAGCFLACIVQRRRLNLQIPSAHSLGLAWFILPRTATFTGTVSQVWRRNRTWITEAAYNEAWRLSGNPYRKKFPACPRPLRKTRQ